MASGATLKSTELKIAIREPRALSHQFQKSEHGLNLVPKPLQTRESMAFHGLSTPNLQFSPHRTSESTTFTGLNPPRVRQNLEIWTKDPTKLSTPFESLLTPATIGRRRFEFVIVARPAARRRAPIAAAGEFAIFQIFRCPPSSECRHADLRLRLSPQNSSGRFFAPADVCESQKYFASY
ncbi:hypothetical protein L596_025205 [Steinernema carpocapsae]|uniref:Uncharacterized protein n=1 Tax=Steinernema carpocapsae TaxID=34508 RepID=A0A4V5ZYS1_STECR|nr:hypothetical protein L596_025205 [Steinernema carpocapsae]